MEFAKPSPLALFRFVFPTIILSICNASLFKVNAALLGLAIAHGGLSQLIVSILLLFKGATFRYVTFLSYGAFWLSVLIILATEDFETKGLVTTVNPFMRAYSPLLGIVFFFCGLCAIRKNRVLLWIFLTLWPSFVLQLVSHGNGEGDILRAGGLLGLICGCLVLYLGMTELETMEHQGTVLQPIRDPEQPKRTAEPATAAPCDEKNGWNKRDIEPAARAVIAQDGHWQDSTRVYSRIVARMNFG